MKLPETSYTFFGWNVLRACSCSIFFLSLPLIFSLVAASISHFLTAATKFSCCSSNKKKVSCVSLALALSRSFSRWAPLACRLLSVFLCLSLLLYSKFVDMTINLSYCFRQHGFPLSVFVFIVSASQDEGGYAISCQNNLVLHLGCHTCWLSYFTSVCLWCKKTDGRKGGRTVTWLPKFLGWVDYHIFLGMGLRSRGLRARVELQASSPLLPPFYFYLFRSHFKVIH